MVSGFLSCFELKLALAELRRATGSLEAVLLALLHTRIAGEEASLLQDGAVLGVDQQQGAGHAAEGYAVATGKVGCAIVTSGPGATNVLTALGDACMDSVPIVVISGQVGASLSLIHI